MIGARSIGGTLIESAPNLSRQESFSRSSASTVKPAATRWSSLRAFSIERIDDGRFLLCRLIHRYAKTRVLCHVAAIHGHVPSLGVLQELKSFLRTGTAGQPSLCEPDTTLALDPLLSDASIYSCLVTYSMA
jgi:hypothetical protein